MELPFLIGNPPAEILFFCYSRSVVPSNWANSSWVFFHHLPSLLCIPLTLSRTRIKPEDIRPAQLLCLC